MWRGKRGLCRATGLPKGSKQEKVLLLEDEKMCLDEVWKDKVMSVKNRRKSPQIRYLLNDFFRMIRFVSFCREQTVE
ncbi:hypothetical protein CEXT_140551 [Caerostris extrusa]|uniref:Uncharacterized protein n=1 Tax=Caerostris extrusa TaxID=172846 RepID=A0AAV4YEL7_CAEEX|nr:hypothetical protein CEXT_140551 [Caerostris extrusa]